VGQQLGTLDDDDIDILYLSNFSSAEHNGLIVQLLSVPLGGYDWFPPPDVDDIYFKLREHIPARGIQYERNIQHHFVTVAYGGGRGTTNGGRAPTSAAAPRSPAKPLPRRPTPSGRSSARPRCRRSTCSRWRCTRTHIGQSRSDVD
jgi:hypothetical protein